MLFFVFYCCSLLDVMLSLIQASKTDKYFINLAAILNLLMRYESKEKKDIRNEFLAMKYCLTLWKTHCSDSSVHALRTIIQIFNSLLLRYSSNLASQEIFNLYIICLCSMKWSKPCTVLSTHSMDGKLSLVISKSMTL